MKHFILTFLSVLSFIQLNLAQVFTPQNGINQIDCGASTTLCDHAGCASNYLSNADGSTVIQVIGTASVTLNGNYDLAAGDQIIIYNGSGTAGTVLSTLTGVGSYNLAGTPGQQVTVRFISDGATNSVGYSFTVTYTGACTFPGVNFGTTGVQSFPCATNSIFYDNGGAGGDYTSNVNSTVVLNNSGVGVYSISGSYTLAVNDFVRIYRGVGTGGVLLQSFTNGTGVIGYTSQIGEVLTVQFQTNGGGVAAGFNFTASHYGGCSCPTVVLAATATPSVICPGQNSQLLAGGVSSLANYDLSNPPYALQPCAGTSTGAGPFGDDVVSGPVTIPFTFTYYGVSYTQFGISTNANIQFGPGPYSSVYTPTGTGIPTTSIDNLVALNFADWLADAGDINWYVQGTSPNRRVVICFLSLTPYPSPTGGSLNGQIVLYEGTNVIDLVLTNSNMAAGASTINLQTQGIQDQQGDGIPVPGRNSTNWTANNSTMRFTPSLVYNYAWTPPTFLNSTTIFNPLASAVTATTPYTVNVGLGTLNACPQSSNVTVTVTPPVVASFTGTTTICNGQSTTLTATGGTTYLWSNGATTPSVTVSPSVNTTFTVTVGNGTPCPTTLNIPVIVNPLPLVSINSGDTIICLGQSATLNATGAPSYNWNTGATTSSITVSPLVTTTYSVSHTLGTCTSTDNITVVVSPSSLPIINCPSNITIDACTPIATFLTPTAIDPCAVTTCAQSPLSTVLSNLTANFAALTAPIASPFNFALDGGVTGTTISDGGSDMYDGGNTLNTNFGASIPYTNGTILGSAAFGAGGTYFTTNLNNMFVMGANMNNVSSFFTTGNNGADGSGTANGFVGTVSSGCLNYSIFIKRVNGAGDPSINHIYIVESTVGASQTFLTNTDNDDHVLNGLNAATRMYYLLVGGAGGYAYTNAELTTIAQNFLNLSNASNGGATPVPVTQIAGPVSGSAFPMGATTVTFQAVGSSATSTCSFTVNVTGSNLPVITCPANITLGSCNAVANFITPTATDPCASSTPCSSNTLANVLSNFNTNGNAITAAISNPFTFALDGGAAGPTISDGGSDMYDGGNTLNTNLGTSIPYTNGVITANTLFGAGGQYFTQKVNNLFVMAADINGLTNFNITGNLGADGSGIVNGFVTSVTVGCLSFDVYVKRVNSAGDPSVNHLFIVPSGSGATQNFPNDTNDDLHNLTGLAAATRLYYLLVAGNAGYAYTDAELTAIAQNFLTQSSAVAGAVSVPPVVTQIAGPVSGSTFPLGTTTVTFQATSTVATNTCSFTVTVVNPSVTITPSATSACAGSPVTLTASGASTYVWSTGATTTSISPVIAAPTSFSVTSTDIYGCTANASQAITMNTSSTNPTIAVAPTSYCPNINITLNAVGGVAGSGSNVFWYTGANGTGTLLGTGNSLVYATPAASTSIYARREGLCGTTADVVIPINVKTFVYALNGTSTNTYCTDNAGWHHFYVGNEIIFSMQGDLSGAVNPTASIGLNTTYYQQTQGPGTAGQCVLNINPGEERFEMARNWNMNFNGGTSSGTYQVRFYHQPAERSAIENAAINWMATYPACTYSYKYLVPLGFFWFKNNSSNYVAPQYDLTQYAATNGATVNGINYAQWSGIPSFSGGSGAVILTPTTPLPVDLLYFSTDCDESGTGIKLSWKVASETNIDRFLIQRSEDGINWNTIQTIPSQGNSTTELIYTTEDKNVRPNSNYYYRLSEIDLDGIKEDLQDAFGLCEGRNSDVQILPNPAQNELGININNILDNTAITIELFDVRGKLVQVEKTKVNNGEYVTFKIDQLSIGTYIVRVSSEEIQYNPIRVVKN